MSLSKVTLINDNKFGYLNVECLAGVIPESIFSAPEGMGTYPWRGATPAPTASWQGAYTTIPLSGEWLD